MLGEVGLDRACRIPYTSPALPPYVENDSRRDLSPFTIPLSHQLAILEAQIELAIELKRNVSFHSVKCQQTTVGLLDKLKAKHEEDWNAISVDMHSCGLSVETWRDIEVCNKLRLDDIELNRLIFRNNTSTFSCHSRQLSTLAPQLTVASLRHVRRTEYSWSLIIMMPDMSRGRLGTCCRPLRK